MTNPREIAGDINVYSGYTFEIALEAQTGSTGYSWALSHMPDSVNLVDIRQETSQSSLCGSIAKQVFVFAAVKIDQSYITFRLIRPWIVGEAVSTKTFALIIVEKPKNLQKELEDTLGHCTFIATDAETTAKQTASGYHQAIPYGFPLGAVEHPEQCLLAYGTPEGLPASATACVLKYGFPVHMLEDAENCNLKYGVPVVKYGFPIIKYGIPVAKNGMSQMNDSPENCLVKYGCPIEMVHDPENCVIKYGIPTACAGEASTENCLVKYGVPTQVTENQNHCIVKYGIPTGIASDVESCVIKYGFPVSTTEDASRCLVKYGVPPEQEK